MHPNASRRVPVALDVIPFSAPPGDLAWVCCPRCGKSLELQQPIIDEPDRLLGVCKECERWVLIELGVDCPEATMVLLPERGWGLTVPLTYDKDGQSTSE